MDYLQKKANRGLLEIGGFGLFWLLISLGIIVFYTPELIRFIYQICQSSIEMVFQHVSANRHLLVPVILGLILLRGCGLFLYRIWQTHQFKRVLIQFQQPLPTRLNQVANQIGLANSQLIYIDSHIAKAFSLGIWRPKIWLSTSLVSLLDDDELKAVLHHEYHHCRQNDPLRLLFSRLIRDCFFFIPGLRTLVDHNHLAQEMAADEAAIWQAGDNLPLASALHKLITYQQPDLPSTNLAISQINITERRILALVSPQNVSRWQSTTISSWAMSLIVACFIFGALFLLDPAQATITPCVG